MKREATGGAKGAKVDVEDLNGGLNALEKTPVKTFRSRSANM